MTVHSELSTNVTVKTVCPELVRYDRTTQARIAEELEQLHGDTVLPEIMNDYAKCGTSAEKSALSSLLSIRPYLTVFVTYAQFLHITDECGPELD